MPGYAGCKPLEFFMLNIQKSIREQGDVSLARGLPPPSFALTSYLSSVASKPPKLRRRRSAKEDGWRAIFRLSGRAKDGVLRLVRRSFSGGGSFLTSEASAKEVSEGGQRRRAARPSRTVLQYPKRCHRTTPTVDPDGLKPYHPQHPSQENND